MIKPDNCPICGSEPDFFVSAPGINHFNIIIWDSGYNYCGNCGFGHTCRKSNENKEEACKSWNNIVKQVKENLRRNYELKCMNDG